MHSDTHARTGVQRRWRRILSITPIIAVLTVILTVVGGLSPLAPIAAASAKSGPQPKITQQPKQHPVPKGLPVLQNGYGPTPQERSAMADAAKAAKGSGKNSEVAALTSETQQVTAKPKGGFSLTTSADPVRTQQNGKWVPVDTTLHRNANGTYSPAATAYGTVTFSGGGTGPAVTTASGGTSYSMSWPGALPVPTVSGSNATYANVLAGVDLVLSATDAGGFSDVFVVHTSAAAQNPVLANLTLPTTVTGGHVQSGPNGVFQVVSAASGGRTLVGATPMMWDSNTKVTVPAAKAGQKAAPMLAPSAVDPSDTSHPGMAARVAIVGDHATNSGLNLVPDHRLLTNPGAAFPLYIDPTFNWDNAAGNSLGFDEVKQGSPCTNSSFYDNSTPDSGNFGMLGAGYNHWSSCIGVERAYLQWQLPSVIWGAHIQDSQGAFVDVDKTYSAACVTTTNWMHIAGGIGPGTSWNSQPYLGPVIATEPIGPTQNCPGGFGDVKAGFDVTGAITQAAANHDSQFTVAITGNESSAASNVDFSRFNSVAQNGLQPPSLQIAFNLPPNTPGPEWAATGSDNVGCATIQPYPYMGKTILTNTPVLNATVSDADPMDSLLAHFHYWLDASPSTVHSGDSGDNLPSGSNAQFSLPSDFVSGLNNGDVVDWQAQATDGEDTSGWGPVCHFIAEPTAPSAPTITSADGQFPNNGIVGASATTKGRFTQSATGAGVVNMIQHLDQAPPTQNPPASDYASMNGGSTISPAARWKLSDNTGSTAADSSGNNHAATLHGGATWTTDASRGPVLSFDGSTGYALTSGPAVNTEGSFTVSAWVDVKAVMAGNWQTFLVQQGTTESGFYLERDPFSGDWSFSMVEADQLNPAADRAESASPTQTGVWTHLVGVYDSANGAMTLYVNGVQSGSATDRHPIAANGPVDIGRGYNANVPGNYSDSSISDVQLYQYPLSATDVTQLYQGKTAAAAARWTFAEGKGTTAADSTGNNHTATLSGGYTWNTGVPSALTFDGSTGSATTSGPILNTLGSFTVSAWIQLQGTTAGQWQTFVVQQAGTNSGFYLERDGDTGDWSFSRVEADASNPPVDRAESSSPTTDDWTHVVGTYDAGSGGMTLYVNGTQSGTATDNAPLASNGPVDIGRGYHLGSAGNYADASIADVQLYPTALNSSEVNELYASATSQLAPLSPGPHTLYGYAANAAGDASGYQAYRFIAAKDPNTSCSSLSACFDNTGISPDSNPGLANFDGEGNSFSATDLTNSGFTSGGKVTVDGGTYALPQYGSGQPDNILSANQTIQNTDPTLSGYNNTVPANGSSQVGTSSLEFLTTATYAYTATPGAIRNDATAPYVSAGTPVAGQYCFDLTNPAAYCPAAGTITYSDGSTQTYYLTVPDWVVGPYGIDTMWMPHENWSGGGQNTTNLPKMYSFSVPLKRGLTISSVTLPDVGDTAGLTTAALHIFSMATRNTTTTSATSQASAQTWTGAWASANEADYGNGNGPNGGFANETFREIVDPSISGNTVRIKLDDALGNDPLQIGHASIAVESANNSPIPKATPVPITFGSGQACPGQPQPCTVIPPGGMLYSDPINFPIAAGQRLLVSVQLVNTVANVPMHTWPTDFGGQWFSVSGSGDETGDMTGTPFDGHGWGIIGSTALVTGLDVVSNATPTLAVLGDGLIDQGQTGSQPTAGVTLADDLIASATTTPNPYGTIGEGIEANQVMTSFPEANASGGPSALARIDRDVLDQPGINTVIVDEGLEDILANQPGPNGQTAEENLTSNGYAELINYLHGAGINIVYVGLTPCDGYAGDGATPNDPCTASVDAERMATNASLAREPGYFLNSDRVVGEPDTTNGETKLSSTTDGGDHVNVTNVGFGGIANAYLASQNEWTLTDGASDNTLTTAVDNGGNGTPYLNGDLQAGNDPLTLNGNASWPTDAERGTVLGLDGTNSDAEAPGAVLDTTGSFSISTWAKLSSTAQDADVVSQDATKTSAFALQYDHADNRWAFTMPTSDTATPTYARVLSTAAPTVGTWAHLVAEYDATQHTMYLYVNGVLMGTAVDATPVNGTGVLALGRGLANGSPTAYFPGSISMMQTWNYTLPLAQMAALYSQIG